MHLLFLFFPSWRSTPCNEYFGKSSNCTESTSPWFRLREKSVQRAMESKHLYTTYFQSEAQTLRPFGRYTYRLRYYARWINEESVEEDAIFEINQQSLIGLTAESERASILSSTVTWRALGFAILWISVLSIRKHAAVRGIAIYDGREFNSVKTVPVHISPEVRWDVEILSLKRQKKRRQRYGD